MSEEHGVSRRASLKTLGALGAAVAFCGADRSAAASPRPVSGGQDKLAADPVGVASARFMKGHNCAGAVLSAFSEPMGIDDKTAVRITAGFGGGMYVGSVCGAVTGGIMAIGLKYGGAQDPKAQKLVREFITRFKAQHKTINCSELTGVDVNDLAIVKKLTADLSKPENLKAAKEALGGREPAQLIAGCTGYVKDAATIVNELVSQA